MTEIIKVTKTISKDDLPKVATIINTAYKIGEKGIFVDTEEAPFTRATIEDLSQWVDSGELLIARASDDDRILGCVRVVTEGMEEGLGEWGVLAVAVEEQGKGFGTQLIEAAEKALEEAGCQMAQVQLIAPVMWVHDHKDRLRVQYEARGYVLTNGDFDDSTTMFEEGALLFGKFTLATDAGFTCYTRELGASAP